VPQWLQNLILYELSWILSVQHRAGGLASQHDLIDEFDALMVDVLDRLDPWVIEGTPVSRVKRLWREMLLHSWRAESWRQEYAVLTRLDEDQDLVQVVYRYTGPPPVEQVMSDGVAVRPAYAKVRDHQVLGRTVMFERILWVPAGGPLRILLDGRDVALETGKPRRTSYTLNAQAIRHRLDRSGPRQTPTVADGPAARPGRVERLARSHWARRRYGDAWLLMDRVFDADDNGQRLFEYLRRERPDIDAWFTVKRGTPAWRALRKRYRGRVLAHGSLRWKLVALNADHLLSSHADLPVVAPRELEGLAVRPRWRFTFLQHGVIKDDLSSWLNVKPIDLFVTSTTAEYRSIVDDHNGYVFTEREAILTGLPRFDRLREIGSRFPPEKRDLVLVAPTWRSWLTGQMDITTQQRELAPTALDSDFVRTWLELLGSQRLRDVAAQHASTVAFLPHPNLQTVLERLTLPSWVQPLTFDDNDVQELFARSRVLVTDYSSMAFNAAYLDRPVVEDGEAAVEAVVTAIAEGLAPEYQRRIDEAFPDRDGRCCERVVDAVLESVRQVPVIALDS
jgi:hypothetical protein